MEELAKSSIRLNNKDTTYENGNNTAMSRAIIDLDAYRHNLQVVRNLVGSHVHIIAVVKANAYGHGVIPIAKCAEAWGVNMLAVANIEEGIKLRENGIKIPILVLLQPYEDELSAIIDYQLTQLISEADILKKISELAVRARVTVPVHCKIDTGMGRQGFNIDTAITEIRKVVHLPHIDLEGIATHFPCADEENDAFTINQIRIFSKLLNEFENNGIPYEFAHAANSPAIINYPKSHFDAVRPGLMTYGIWPTKKIKDKDILKPILRWETRVIQVRTLNAGNTIGYGRTFTATHDMDVAILPVGYADGFRSQLSNGGEVLIHGCRCPVRGNVSMDQIVVELKTPRTVKRGDTATLIGKDGNEEITVEEFATRAGTITYDVLTGIGNRVHRIYINEERPSHS
ncbi:MAG: alanine racemase [Candidatus Hydrogenedens sp.]|nr:alanine racemase [Candidatus Hydrogenedens sp.]